jgi:hypothetical protein
LYVLLSMGFAERSTGFEGRAMRIGAALRGNVALLASVARARVGIEILCLSSAVWWLGRAERSMRDVAERLAEAGLRRRDACW